ASPEAPLLLPHSSAVVSASFSPDGGRVLSVGSDGDVRVWDADTGGQLAILPGGRRRGNPFGGNPFGDPPNPPVRAQFVGSGARVRIESPRLGIRVWDVSPAREPTVLWKVEADGPVGEISSDGNWICTWDGDCGAVRDSKTGSRIASLATRNGEVHGKGQERVMFSSDSTKVALLSDRAVYVWEAKTGRELLRCDRPTAYHGRALSPSGRLLAVETGAGGLRVWNLATGEPLSPVFGLGGAVQTVSFGPDDRRGGTAGGDVAGRILGAAPGRPLPTP